MPWLLRLLPGPQSLAVRYGVTAAMVIVTFALYLATYQPGGPHGFILFVPAIVAASLLFDRGSGFFALGLSIALVAAIIRWGEHAAVQVAGLLIFAAVGALLVWTGEGLHRAVEQAQAAEQAQRLLLQEMSHRVKNKFAMILSLIGLQARQSAPETRGALEAIAQRVRVIANVHDHLQLARQGNRIEIAQYLEDLCNSLGDSMRELRPVTVSVHAENLTLAPEQALTVGLIVNELVTNAFKHAFSDDRIGRVTVELRQTAGQIELSVTDDGVGCPQEAMPGLGTRLVGLLVDQLGGVLDRQNLGRGCRVVVTFDAVSGTASGSDAGSKNAASVSIGRPEGHGR